MFRAAVEVSRAVRMRIEGGCMVGVCILKWFRVRSEEGVNKETSIDAGVFGC
jgi:hypothetical protein